MLEILFIGFLCRNIGEMCRRKRRGAIGFQVMLVLFWIGGEVLGAIIGAVIAPGETAPIYIMALVGAGVGATVVFVIVGALSATRLQRANTGPSMPEGGSDWEIQILWNMEQECERRGDWRQALENLQQILAKSSNPQFAVPAQQRYLQIQQWLAQQAAARPGVAPTYPPTQSPGRY